MPQPDATARMVVIVVFDGVKLLDAAGPAEVFVDANRFGANYSLVLASVDGRDVVTSIGTRLAVTARIADLHAVDTVVVAGGEKVMIAPTDPTLIEAVRLLSKRTRRLTSVCTGAFILAQAGLLEGRRVTTHWRHTRLLARDFPDLNVQPDAIYVQDGEVYTSAGVTAGIDLALALVEMDHDADLVRKVARALVVYLKRAGGQSQFSALLDVDPPPRSQLQAVVNAVIGDPGGDHRVTKLAARAGLSTRQLTRLFQTELGTTPSRYVELVRIDVARAALDSGRTVTQSSRLAGFGSVESMRRVFRAQLGITPKAYRERFRTAAPSVT